MHPYTDPVIFHLISIVSALEETDMLIGFIFNFSQNLVFSPNSKTMKIKMTPKIMHQIIGWMATQ